MRVEQRDGTRGWIRQPLVFQAKVDDRSGADVNTDLIQRTLEETGAALRANIDETVLLVVITEQGENRNQCEEQRNLFGFLHGFARRGT